MGDPAYGGGVDPVDHGEQQEAPGQREGETDPAVKTAELVLIVPKRDMEDLLIEEGGDIFHGGGGKSAEEKQRRRDTEHRRREEEDRAGPQSVYRAQGEEEQTFPIWISTGPEGISYLQQEAEKTIEKEIPEPLHSLPS